MHPTTKRLYQAAAQLRHIHTPADLAHALKLSHQTLRNWEQKGISKKGVQEARLVLGVSADWLATGQGEMSEHADDAMRTSDTITPMRTTLPNHHHLMTQALTRLSLCPDHIINETVQDDNMLHTLAIGDTVLIDTSVQAYIGSGVYCVAMPFGKMIYRIKAFQHGIMLINDNPAYPPELIRLDEMHTLHIIGRVVGKYGIVAL